MYTYSLCRSFLFNIKFVLKSYLPNYPCTACKLLYASTNHIQYMFHIRVRKQSTTHLKITMTDRAIHAHEYSGYTKISDRLQNTGRPTGTRTCTEFHRTDISPPILMLHRRKLFLKCLLEHLPLAMECVAGEEMKGSC